MTRVRNAGHCCCAASAILSRRGFVLKGRASNPRPSMTVVRTDTRHRSRPAEGVQQLVLFGDAADAQGRARGDVRDLRLLPPGGRHRRRRHRHARRAPRRAGQVARRSRRPLCRPSAGARAISSSSRSSAMACARRISSPSSTAWTWTSPRTSSRPISKTLDLYCERVASAVGRLSIKVFGMEEGPGFELAHHLGRALQLTNILRDIDEDAAIGRLYLPREYLRDAGIAIARSEGGHRRSADRRRLPRGGARLRTRTTTKAAAVLAQAARRAASARRA